MLQGFGIRPGSVDRVWQQAGIAVCSWAVKRQEEGRAKKDGSMTAVFWFFFFQNMSLFPSLPTSLHPPFPISFPTAIVRLSTAMYILQNLQSYKEFWLIISLLKWNSLNFSRFSARNKTFGIQRELHVEYSQAWRIRVGPQSIYGSWLPD